MLILHTMVSGKLHISRRHTGNQKAGPKPTMDALDRAILPDPKYWTLDGRLGYFVRYAVRTFRSELLPLRAPHGLERYLLGVLCIWGGTQRQPRPRHHLS